MLHGLNEKNHRIVAGYQSSLCNQACKGIVVGKKLFRDTHMFCWEKDLAKRPLEDRNTIEIA